MSSSNYTGDSEDESCQDGADSRTGLEEGDDQSATPTDDQSVSRGEVHLTESMMKTALSVLGKTGDGLQYAFVRCELHRADLTDISVIRNYPHLRFVDFANNRIQSVAALDALEFLSHLNMESNGLASIDLAPRQYLQAASFARNRVTSIDGATHPLLTSLDLSFNQFSSIWGLENLVSLRSLNLQGNKLSSTAGVHAASLVELSMADNAIARIADLDSLTALTTLDLRGNQLAKLSGFTDALKSLKTLDLSGNEVGAFSELALLSVLPALEHLLLFDNPLVDVDDFRLEVAIVLPKLVALNSEAFSDAELEEAKLIAAERAETAVRVKAEEAARAQREAEEKAALEAAALREAEELRARALDVVPEETEDGSDGGSGSGGTASDAAYESGTEAD